MAIIMDETIRTCLDVLRDKMRDMTDDERLYVISALTDDYCTECGGKYIP